VHSLFFLFYEYCWPDVIRVMDQTDALYSKEMKNSFAG
jgi:hypothetical protein